MVFGLHVQVAYSINTIVCFLGECACVCDCNPHCWVCIPTQERVAVTGMQDIDKQTSQALLEFSYHLAIGDTNEAYKVLSTCNFRFDSCFTNIHIYYFCF